MFTPAVTAHEPQTTASPYALPLVSSVARTTLIQELRRDPPALLTNDRTCGYTSGAWSSAVTCGPGHSCTYYTTPYSAPNFGCCTNGAECGYVSTCVDYKAEGNPNTIGGYLFMDKGMYWYGFSPALQGRTIELTVSQWIGLSILLYGFVIWHDICAWLFLLLLLLWMPHEETFRCRCVSDDTRRAG